MGCHKTKGLGQGAVDCGTVIGNIWGKLMEDKSYVSRFLYRRNQWAPWHPAQKAEARGNRFFCSQTRNLEFKLNLFVRQPDKEPGVQAQSMPLNLFFLAL